MTKWISTRSGSFETKLRTHVLLHTLRVKRKVKSLNLTFAVQQTRVVEFLVKPTQPPVPAVR